MSENLYLMLFAQFVQKVELNCLHWSPVFTFHMFQKKNTRKKIFCVPKDENSTF